MRQPFEDDKAEAEKTLAETPKRLAWEEPTLHVLSLTKAEAGVGINPDGFEFFVS